MLPNINEDFKMFAKLFGKSKDTKTTEQKTTPSAELSGTELKDINLEQENILAVYDAEVIMLRNYINYISYFSLLNPNQQELMESRAKSLAELLIKIKNLQEGNSLSIEEASREIEASKARVADKEFDVLFAKAQFYSHMLKLFSTDEEIQERDITIQGFSKTQCKELSHYINEKLKQALPELKSDDKRIQEIESYLPEVSKLQKRNNALWNLVKKCDSTEIMRTLSSLEESYAIMRSTVQALKYDKFKKYDVLDTLYTQLFNATEAFKNACKDLLLSHLKSLYPGTEEKKKLSDDMKNSPKNYDTPEKLHQLIEARNQELQQTPPKEQQASSANTLVRR